MKYLCLLILLIYLEKIYLLTYNWDDEFMKRFLRVGENAVNDVILASMLINCINKPKKYNYIDNMCDAIRHYKSNSGTTVKANSNLIEHMKKFNNILFNLIGLNSYSNIIKELTGIIRNKIKNAKNNGLTTAVIQNSPGSYRSACYLTVDHIL